jgi:type I restriction enzyme, S subunit
LEGGAAYFAPEILGAIPRSTGSRGEAEGGEVRPLASIASLVRDAITPASFAEELFDHYSIPAFDDGQTPVREAGVGILSNKTLVPSDAILLSKLNPEFPRVWLVDTDGVIRSICSTEFLVLSPKVPADRAFLYSLATESSFRQRLEAMVTGTSKSHQRVSPRELVMGREGVLWKLVVATERHK